jgi:hypothetical protein
MFELTKEEYDSLRRRFGTLKRGEPYMEKGRKGDGQKYISNVSRFDRRIGGYDYYGVEAVYDHTVKEL